MAEATDSYGTYHYAMDNPVMFNDPMGNTAPKYTVLDAIASIMSDPRGKANGGYWSSRDSGNVHFFEDQWDAFGYTTDVIDLDNGGGGGWGGAFTEDYNTAYKNFVEGKAATPGQRGVALRQVDIKEQKRTRTGWLIGRRRLLASKIRWLLLGMLVWNGLPVKDQEIGFLPTVMYLQKLLRSIPISKMLGD